jgi:hypothetical protein
MRILVCGSRHFTHAELMEDVLKQWNIHTIIEGEARGADTLAREYAERHGIHVLAFPAQWDTHGKAAGPIRNAQMLREGQPELVVAFRGINSRGTQNMINQAEKARVEVYVVDVF